MSVFLLFKLQRLLLLWILKAVRSKPAFCLMVHEGLTHQFHDVMQQWRRDVGPGTHVFLGSSTETEVFPTIQSFES